MRSDDHRNLFPNSNIMKPKSLCVSQERGVAIGGRAEHHDCRVELMIISIPTWTDSSGTPCRSLCNFSLHTRQTLRFFVRYFSSTCWIHRYLCWPDGWMHGMGVMITALCLIQRASAWRTGSRVLSGFHKDGRLWVMSHFSLPGSWSFEVEKSLTLAADSFREQRYHASSPPHHSVTALKKFLDFLALNQSLCSNL